MSKIENILDGDGGFTPQVPADGSGQAAWERHTATQPAPESDDLDLGEPEAALENVTGQETASERNARLSALGKPDAPKPAAADIALLRASGWSADDIQALSPEAAARHALREGGRGQKPKADAERAEEPDSDLEALLTEEFSAKTAKRLAPFLQGLAKKQAALSSGVREQSLEGLRERYIGAYPELERPEVQIALLAVLGTDNPSREQYERGLRVLYSVRQTPDERREAREQVAGQFGSGGRGPAPAKDPEAAKRAAWNHFRKTGDADAASKLRGRLSTR